MATRQWRSLKAILEEVGAKVETLKPVEGLPDLVFTANAALVHREQAILARFRHPQRQGEEPYDEAWLAAHGFRVVRPPTGVFFEGAGDALFCGDTLLAGYRIRRDARFRYALQCAEMFGFRHAAGMQRRCCGAT